MLSLILHAYLRLTNKGVILQSHPNLSILKLIDRLHSFSLCSLIISKEIHNSFLRQSNYKRVPYLF